MVNAKINGTDVRFTLDSGAFYSMISPASAAALKLRTYPAPPDFYIGGVGGSIRVDAAKADDLNLSGITLHNVEFMVGGNDEGGDSIGLLGRNLILIADTDFDLAQGVVRLLSPQDCDDTVLAYWVHSGSSYSVMDIEKPPHPPIFASRKTKDAASFLEPIKGTALVNGVKIRVKFDTGATSSFLTLRAAAKVGIKLESPAVTPAGYAGGIGRGLVATYLAPVESFKIGDEEVRNTQLRLGDTDIDGTDMLIGADFFLSHHIYVASSQHKLYFTYNGGPVFNLKTVVAASTQPPVGPAAQTATQDPQDAGDASDYARRGAAFAARRDFDQALRALTRACELAPDNPENFYQRGMVFWESNQPGRALTDFDRALQLKPSYVLALLARSDLRMQTGNKAGAETDLDAANTAASRADAAHYSLAAGYMRLGRFTRALEQFDLWIAFHPMDANLSFALSGRCRAGVLGNIALRDALTDCNKALSLARKSSPFYAEVLDNRGLVWLRLGEYDKSTADFDASLEITPRNAWSLYGRGIGKIRANKTSDGEADIAQAKVISPDIVDALGKYGILP